MRPDAVVVTGGAPTPAGERLALLIEHLGVRPRRLGLSEAVALLRRREGGGRPRLVAIDLGTAASVAAETPSALEELARLAPALLVHGTSRSEAAGRALALLTDGAVTGTLPAEDRPRTLEVTTARPAMSGPLTGARLGPVPLTQASALSAAEDRAIPILLADGEPLFLEVIDDGRPGPAGPVYVLGCEEPIDLDEPVDRLRDVARLPSFAPVAMVLRAVYGESVWRASGSYACVVVDDPLLRRRYGPLDYARLLRRMDESDFATSVAFIPFNRGRTRESAARLFRERPDRLSVCVHGCDHTRGEFGTSDRERLRASLATADERMAAHRSRHGVAHDRVMVFPQGVFSGEAVRAVRDAGFSSAVNSGPKAADDTRELTVRDFLDVGIRRYGGFSVLVRRALDDPDVVGDVFLGRPALLVVHPSDLAEDDDRLARAVGRLNALPGGVRWRGLGAISEELHLRRLVARGRLHVRLTSPRTTLRNDSAEEPSTVLAFWDDPDGAAESVTVSGRRVPVRRRGGKVFFRLVLPPGGEERIEIAMRQTAAAPCARSSAGERARVALRRRLSELRDTHPGPSAVVLRVVGRRAGRG